LCASQQPQRPRAGASSTGWATAPSTQGGTKHASRSPGWLAARANPQVSGRASLQPLSESEKTDRFWNLFRNRRRFLGRNALSSHLLDPQRYSGLTYLVSARGNRMDNKAEHTVIYAQSSNQASDGRGTPRTTPLRLRYMALSSQKLAHQLRPAPLSKSDKTPYWRKAPSEGYCRIMQQRQIFAKPKPTKWIRTPVHQVFTACGSRGSPPGRH
jgi:hypothetical protein